MARLARILSFAALLAACADDSSDSARASGDTPPAETGGSAGSAGSGGAPGASNAGGGGQVATGAGGAGSAAVGSAGTSAGGASSWGSAACGGPASEVGFAVGDHIGALSVLDCTTGKPATIDELCGANATWIFAAHSHCPTCKATAGFTDDVANAFADQGVAVAHILYDDVNVSCAVWAKAYGLEGLPNVKVYQDPTGAVWAALKTSNYTAPSAFLDGNRVITHKAHGLTREGVEAQLKVALSQ